MKIALIRHTRLAETAAGVCYGRSEMPLAETFAVEVEQVRAALPWRPELIWTSPTRRCRALADALSAPPTSESATAAVREDSRLAELHFGVWEGQRWDDLKGPEVDWWMHDPWHARPPGGETADELIARVRAFRDELLAAAAPERVAVVTHAGVIRAWRSLAESIALERAFAQAVPYGQVFIFNR